VIVHQPLEGDLLRLLDRDWQAAQMLRQSVLGWAAGVIPGDTDVGTRHLFAVDPDGRDAAVVSFAPHPCPSRPGTGAFYLWGMAVAPGRQRSGVGARLVNTVLDSARKAGAAVVWADARVEAVGFYARLGAVTEGGVHLDSVSGLSDQRVVFDLAASHFRRAK